MPVSLSLIKQVIETQDVVISEKEFDENFNSITSYMERGEHEEATPLIESSFKENICDIRLAMYYMYLCVLKGGIKSLCEVIPLLDLLITEHWEDLSPLPKREQHAQKSIRWFLSRVIKTFEKIHHSYKNKDPSPLNGATAGVTEQMVPTLKSDVMKLNKTFLKKWENPTLGNNLMSAQKWAVDLSQTYFSLVPKKEETPEEVKVVQKVAKGTKAKEPKKEEPSPVKETDRNTIPSDVLEPSQQMVQLFQKLQAFQVLVEKGDYKKASIIAEDIDKKIASFDPLEYFPKIFVKYYSLYAKHAAKIGEGLAQTHPTLLKLYETDLEEFISW